MNNTIGKHWLLEIYNCNVDKIKKTTPCQTLVMTKGKEDVRLYR